MKNHYPFELLPLPYATDSLEPYIDKVTMEIHHGKHVQTYVDNLNNALKDHKEYHDWSLEKLLYNLDKLPASLQAPVRNNGGGVFNHNLYFKIMTKDGKSLSDGPLKKAIERDFGSLDNLKTELKNGGLTQFGSGWSWLVSDKDGKLSVRKTPNQDTLIAENLTPVLNLDVWEHAYYLLRQNRRPEYIDNWFNVVNWEEAEKNYSKHKETDYSKS
ncbi:MAG: superoxide dismutase [Defluviitaleaceae bacterium]|nr:superoxide dismutase [Defluviitaleaceae bacterium]